MISHQRLFSSSSTLFKKANKGKKSQTESSSTPIEDSATEEDHSDLAPLRTQLSGIISQLSTNLSKLRPSGRFNPEALESLRVTIKEAPSSPSSDSSADSSLAASATDTTIVRLADIAQVTPGNQRQIYLHISEKAYVKAVVSALAHAPASLNLPNFGPPQIVDANEPLRMVLNIPPPTGEDRDRAMKEAERAGEKAKGEIRERRAGWQKRLRRWEVEGGARKDELVRVRKEMERVVEEGGKAVKEKVDAVVKGGK